MKKHIALQTLSIVINFLTAQVFEESTIIQEDLPFNSIRSIDITDIDNDGMPDIVVGSLNGSGSILDYYKNLGNSTFSSFITIENDSISEAAYDVQAADIDGDGDNDILAALFSDSRIVSYINNGDGSLTLDSEISQEISNPWTVETSDLDNDGDLDLISADMLFNGGGSIYWWENNGLGDFTEHFVSEIVITESVLSKCFVVSKDLNGDSYNDVIAAIDDRLIWYENDGSGNFGIQQVISLEISNPRKVQCTDLDQDGDFDVLVASFGDDELSWFQNNGLGVFENQQVIESGTENPSAFCVFDIDLDGDLDIVLLSYGFDLRWLANDSEQNFDYHELISSDIDAGEDIRASDMDADGDLDLVLGSWYGREVILYENTGHESCSAQIEVSESTLTASEGSSYQWYLNNEPLEGATSQDLMYSQSGTYTVLVTNEQNCNALSAGILILNNAELEKETILLYPNPMTDRAFLEFEDGSSRTVKLLDSSGKEVRAWNSVATQKIEINRDELDAGNYVISIDKGSSIRNIQLVIR